MWRVVFNQNVFQLILQLGRCSLALAHTRDDIASSAMRVINIMMTDWRSGGTASAPWQLGPSKQRHLTGMTSPHLIQHGRPPYKGHGQRTSATAHPLGSGRKGNDTDTEAAPSHLPPSLPSTTHPSLRHSYKDTQPNKQRTGNKLLPTFFHKKCPRCTCVTVLYCILSHRRSIT